MLADHSRNLEFATRRGVDSGAIFKGMTHSGSPSLHDLLEESPTRMIRSRARGCNMVMSTTPVMTTPPPDETLVF
jgi:hypothetical protein